MKKVLLTVVVMFLLFGSTFVYAGDSTEALDAAWNQRTGDITKAKEMVAQAEKAFADSPGFETAWRAARACFWVCDRTTDKNLKVEYGKKGADLGRKAVSLNPARVEGHYFACICLGEYGTGIGVVKAVTQGLGKEYEALGNKAISIKADYDYAGPLRAMGRYYQKLPKLVRKLDKAEEYLKKSEAAAPCMTRTRFYLTELYMEQENWDKAKASAKAGLETEACPAQAWECNYYKNEIKKLMEKFQK